MFVAETYVRPSYHRKQDSSSWPASRTHWGSDWVWWWRRCLENSIKPCDYSLQYKGNSFYCLISLLVLFYLILFIRLLFVCCVLLLFYLRKWCPNSPTTRNLLSSVKSKIAISLQRRDNFGMREKHECLPCLNRHNSNVSCCACLFCCCPAVCSAVCSALLLLRVVTVFAK